MPIMEFRKFRQDGALSDVQVKVNGTLHKLHRFPLYTRSDYFLKELTKLGPQQDLITIENFPGGSEVFRNIADFCYNITVEITSENIVGLRCGARFLEMNGSENLYEKTGIFFQACLAETKRGKSIINILKILTSIADFRPNEEATKSFDECVAAITHHWNKCQYGTLAIDEVSSTEVQKILLNMNFDLFVEFLAACKKKLESDEVLNSILSNFISHQFGAPKENGEVSIDEPTENGTHSNEESTETTQEHKGDAISTPSSVNISEESLGIIKILLEKVKPNLSRSAATRWLKPLLTAYAQVEGSNEMLGEIAASMVNQIDRECLGCMNEKTLVNFVERINPSELQDRTVSIIVHHLLEESTHDRITTPVFKQISEILPIEKLACHDSILSIVGQLFSRDDKMGDETKDLLLKTIDMNKCTVNGLKQAHQIGGVPAAQIADAALSLCEQYKDKLEASTRIIQDQEKEISSLSKTTFGVSSTNGGYYTPRKAHSFPSKSTTNHNNPPPHIEVTSPRMQDSSTAGLGRLLDSVWYDSPTTPPNLYESNTKLSELLRKQRKGARK